MKDLLENRSFFYLTFPLFSRILPSKFVVKLNSPKKHPMQMKVKIQPRNRKMNTGDIKKFTEDDGQFSTAGRARTAEQYELMKKAEEEEKCLFCHPEDWENAPIWISRYWIVKLNDFPYKEHQLHLIIVWKPENHLEDIQAVPEKAWLEMDILLDRIKVHYSLSAINFVMRFGDPSLRSSTIHHIHGHVQIPSEAVLPERPPLTINWKMKDPLWKSEKLVSLSMNPAPHQKKFVILQHGPSIQSFATLMTDNLGALQFIQDQKIQGGGIVYREGDRRYTNAKFVEPHITIYAPDGTGRVHATLVPPKPRGTKPACKVTFCKGFEGEELEKLHRRMEEFTGNTNLH